MQPAAHAMTAGGRSGALVAGGRGMRPKIEAPQLASAR